MLESHADAIWNRAALEDGGAHPKAGDSALASLLLAPGYVMNGGVHHAVECLSAEELAAAVAGYSYFGLSSVGEILTSAAHGLLSPCTEASEPTANEAYWRLVPDDESLAQAFEAVLRERPHDFAPIAV